VLALVQRRQVVCVPAVYQFAIAKEAPGIEASFGVAVTVLGVNKETDLLMVTVTEKPCARSNLEEAVKAVHQTILSKMGDVVVCVPAEPGKTQDTLFIMVDNSNMCVHAHAQLALGCLSSHAVNVCVCVQRVDTLGRRPRLVSRW
jgi:hypothetical protein